MKKVSPKKHLGQHFLKHSAIAEKIADTLTCPSGNVLEIGPGMGILTQFLLQKKWNLKVVEIDSESVKYLLLHYPDLTVISDDFLKIDLHKIFDNQEFSIIGNFPYNISSQIVFKTIENKEFIPEFAGMFQKEVAERIAAAPGTKTYGILSVLMQTFYDVKYCFSVSEKSFSPPPKVKSGVIHCLRKTDFQIPVNEKLFFDVVKTAFNQRRKTLRNSLAKFGEIPSKYQPLRAEQLHYSDFIEITKSIAEK